MTLYVDEALAIHRVQNFVYTNEKSVIKMCSMSGRKASVPQKQKMM